ncbi:hypothetical protein CMUS01_10612 [Colletotrichum musicola]|uniref:Uncharacterized protein n=1 Tax=Colletotrichum musicola TaxID=2175873 RepID=A0A8H6N8S5_9PEZI|nr:hypothetical protein CMUS01_10612 [Colletotrichum musicola]
MEAFGIAGALPGVLSLSHKTQAIFRTLRDALSERPDDRIMERLTTTSTRINEISSLYKDLVREQHGELPEYASADFQRTLERTYGAMVELSVISLDKWTGKRKLAESELNTALSHFEENSRAVESIFQTLVIQVNMAATSDLIKAIQESSKHPLLPFERQPTEKRQVLEGSLARHATDDVRERFVLPSMLKFVGCKSFVCSLPVFEALHDGLFTEVDDPDSLQGWLLSKNEFQVPDEGTAFNILDKDALLDALAALEIPHDTVYRALEGVPMLLEQGDPEQPSYILIMCELLAVGGLVAVRRTASDLQHVEARTGLSGVFDKWKDSQSANASAQASFEAMTQSLNRAISRLPEHEARVEANILLAGRILSTLSKIEQSLPEDETKAPENSWSKSMQASTARLKHRLHVLDATHQGILLEIRRESNKASSQLQIVYNLVAQRDNQSNYEMANLSLQIARTAKDDSFAMFTLATMSIIFLPGASIATLFSMELFNWSPENGEPIVSPRFWIFWAVAVPLTLVVLTVWLLWLKMHRRREERRSKALSNGPIHQRVDALDSGRPGPQANKESTLCRRLTFAHNPFSRDVEPG